MAANEDKEIVAIKRQLKIKAGVVTRLNKEALLYKKEAEQQKIKVDKLVADGLGRDEWDIKNGQRMLEEANKMITDSTERLGGAAGDLRDYLLEAKKNPKLQGSEELLNAEGALETVTA